jgi:hypothetical protein
MPDYSDDEIDKISDDVSESDEVLVDGKPVKNHIMPGSDNENVKINFFDKVFSLCLF